MHRLITRLKIILVKNVDVSWFMINNYKK